ncbi:MAG: Lar family restriction alleviation protein [Clostridia bacterium]|nr:Lar family restriction alleviation protein [Clostridia bacterium]
MKALEEYEIVECPICQGTGLIQEENGWCVYVECLCCGSHTVSMPFENEQEREKAAKAVADLWNMGKVISAGVGE